MKKNILIVNWGTFDKEYIFQILYKRGLNIFLATSHSFPSWVRKHIPLKQLIFTNTYDSERLIIDVAYFLRKNTVKLDAVTTFFEMNVVQTADLAFALGHKFMSPRAARFSSGNKLLMRLKCDENKIRSPRWGVFNNPEDGFKLLRKIKPPVVIKPVKSGHSFGAVLITSFNKQKFLQLFNQARKQLDSCADEWMRYYNQYKNYFLIEKYVAGPVVSVDGLIQNGQIMIYGLARHIMSDLPLLLQRGVYIPGDLSARATNLCFTITKKILSALEFDNCGFHCELRYTTQGPVLLEIAARPPGGNMLEGYNQAYGVDFINNYLKIFLGEKIYYEIPKIKRYVVQSGISATKPGIINRVGGVDKIFKLASLKNLFYLKSGDWVDFFAGIPDFLLSYRLTCSSRDQLKQDEKFIIENFSYSYYPKAYFNFRKLLSQIKRKVNRL